jgi:Subtilase family
MRRPNAALVLALTLAWLAPAAAEMPYPSNPLPCDETDTDPACIEATAFAQYLFLPTTTLLTLPDDFGNDWKLTSGATGDPAIDGSAQELFGVTGASVDRAWQTTTGRPDVLIAVLDSGIRWAEPQPDLVNKFYLNRGELPAPEGSTNARDAYDRNGDGLFNIADYLADNTHAQDARVSDQNGNGIIDPEDLIFIFSNGVDGDDNGYVDDISGWDFFEDDNDPLDEVRYGHGTGESRDSGSETNNGTGGVGTCPNCLLLEVRVGDSFVTEVNAFARGVVFAVDSGAHVVQEALGTLNNSRFGQEAVDYAYDNGVVVIASAADEESAHHNYPANYNHTVQVNSVTRFANLAGFVQEPRSYLYLNGCTNYGAHIALSVPSSSCSSEATGRSSGMAGLVVSAARNAVDRGMLERYPRDDGSPAPFSLSAEEIKQILIQTTDDINFDARDDVTPALPQNYSSTFAPWPSERFHSIGGFDQYFGYGRINADRAVLRVASGQIPPEASIESPAWFDVIDPQAGPTLTINGRVAANRAASYRYVLEVAPGVQPRESDFEQVGGEESLTSATVGALGEIDLAALAARLPRGVEGPPMTDDGEPDPDRFTVTVRVRVTDDQGNAAEDRRAFALHHDDDLLPGFPRLLGGDGASAAVTADLDADGREEIILGSSDGAVHAYRADASEIPGWPVHTDPLEIHADSPGYGGGAITTPVYSSILAGVSVGDLDRDGTLEVVATDLQGRLYVWDADGQRRAGFPVRTLPEYSFAFRSERDFDTPDGQVPDRTNRHDDDNRLGRALLGGVALGNLDGSADGSLEIVAGAFDRHLYAWHHDGTPVLGWPLLLKDPSKVAAVDPVTNEVTLVSASGGRIGTKIIVPPSLGDLDGDGTLEVVAAVNEEYIEPPNAVFANGFIRALQATGTLDSGNTRVYAVYADGVAHGGSTLERGWNPAAFVPGWPVKTALLQTDLLPTVGTGSNGPPALADVDGNGTLEIATMPAVGPLYVFTADGVSFFGQHATGEDRTLESDVLGTGTNSTDAPSFGALGALALAEFGFPGQGFHLVAPAAGLGTLVDNQVPARQIPADNHLGAWIITDANGAASDRQMVPAFPRLTNDLQFLSGPSLADIDGDGLPEALEGSGIADFHAVDIDGSEAAGWPKFTNGWMVQSPAVGDIDGDGLLEVVGSTREGRLFAWNTTGDECGFIPWRRWHHDEWGSGNYHTDARPPASLKPQEVTATAMGPLMLRLDLARVPGDGLFCGTAAFDVRVSDTPIVDDAGFAAATALRQVDAPVGRRGPGSVTATDTRLVGQTLYIGLVVRDGAGNRSELVSVGPVTFPEEEPPSPTPTPSAVGTTPTATVPSSPHATFSSTVSPTVTASAPPTSTLPSTATATRTSGFVTVTVAPTVTATIALTPPLTATRTVPATSTPTTPKTVDSGCAVVPAQRAGSGWWMAALALALSLARRRRAGCAGPTAPARCAPARTY